MHSHLLRGVAMRGSRIEGLRLVFTSDGVVVGVIRELMT